MFFVQVLSLLISLFDVHESNYQHPQTLMRKKRICLRDLCAEIGTEFDRVQIPQ